MHTKPSEAAVPRRGRFPLEVYLEGVRSGDRVTLARALSLVESDLPEDMELAARLLDAILPHTGKSRRVGITGVPGAGKSTFIDSLGLHLVRERGETVAVLGIDPASPVSGGSILGDKTRMERLCLEENAFIRPCSSRGQLGGLAPQTHEMVLLCEAAGFTNILIETVGAGQSEIAVRSIADFFLLLLVPHAGDELQGVKRGIIEMADAIAINKADGENQAKAERTRAEYASALHLFPLPASGWQPRVVTCSALTGKGVREIWSMILEHRAHLESNRRLAELRERQAIQWMRELVVAGLERELRQDPRIACRMAELEEQVRAGRTSPLAASREALALFRKRL